jgi:hypothetical protein
MTESFASGQRCILVRRLVLNKVLKPSQLLTSFFKNNDGGNLNSSQIAGDSENSDDDTTSSEVLDVDLAH